MENTLLEILELAVKKHNKGQINEAEKLYVQAIELDETHPTAYYNLGLIYQEKQDDESAELFFQKTIELNPSYVESYMRLAQLYYKHNLHELELLQYEKALRIDSSREEIYHNLGRIYLKNYEFEKALVSFKKLLIVEPNNVDILNKVGSCYQLLNDIPQAKLYYEKALSLNPHNISTLYNLSYIYLLQKDYLRGFDLYRNRYSVVVRGDTQGGVAYPPTLLTPADDIKDKTVYISHEQGLGDTITFARFFPLFVEKGAKIVSYVPPSLTKLLAYNYPEINFIAPNSDITFDYNFPMMEAPYLLRTTFENIPFCEKYLQVNSADTLHFQEKQQFTSKYKLGIVFKGSSADTAIKNRSINVEALLQTLIKLPKDIELFSLQYDATPEELALLQKYGVKDLANEIEDFYDTAVMIDAMDMMVSVDTSVLNLCGALGKTTIGLLNFTNLWRWVQDTDTHSIWYRSISLLQQTEYKNWDNVLENLNQKIVEKLCLTQ